MTVDVIITTLNEESHIRDAVESAQGVGRVFVVDSGSTDGTRALAALAGAAVFEHAFDSYAAQKNWALENLPLESEWVFILDADERITRALTEEVRSRIAARPSENGFFVNRLLLFMGTPVRHGGLYPSWNLRLFRRGKARYESRSVHEHMICDGSTGYLKREMLHIRRETISQFITKHIHYADLEADEWIRHLYLREQATRLDLLFRRMLLIRQWLRRNVWPRLPLRPLWRFLYIYIVRLGFVDGAAGWHMAWLMACYEYMIGALYREKLRQLSQSEAGNDANQPPTA